MKAIYNAIRKTNNINEECVITNRRILKFSNTKNTLWNGVKPYAH